MDKTVKIAFVDCDTGDFYVREDPFKNFLFGGDVTKAKLYSKRSEVRDYFEYVKNGTKRSLKCVDVEIEFSVLGDSNYLDKLDNHDHQLYNRLKQQADDDVDSMSEQDYRKWKLLRSRFGK
jgi:magnesium-transporting ATPase (P-type)